MEIYWGSDGRLPILGQVDLTAEVDAKAFLEAGWTRVSEKPFPTFTTSRPSPRPLRRPAGFHDCDEQEKERWRADAHRFPPYQYKACHCLQDRQGNLRTPSVQEREAILGFPPNYTLQCFKKGLHGSNAHEDCRLSLVGNSWSVGVIAWLLQQLTGPLGLTNAMSVQQIVDELTQEDLTACSFPQSKLVEKLAGLTSLKEKTYCCKALRKCLSSIIVFVQESRETMAVEGRGRLEMGGRPRTYQCFGSQGSVDHTEVASLPKATTKPEMRAPSGQPGSAPRPNPWQILIKEDETYHDADKCLHPCNRAQANMGLHQYQGKPGGSTIPLGYPQTMVKKVAQHSGALSKENRKQIRKNLVL